MKQLFKITLFAAGLFAAAQSRAQTHKDSTFGHKVGTTTKKVGHATAVTATKVGNKTAELAVKGASAVVDKKYDGKVAPGGQTVYINKHSHYYYVNKKGGKVYVNKSELRDKPSK